MSSGPSKRIKTPESSKGQKIQAHPTPTVNANTLHPAFSTKYLDKGKYGIKNLSKDDKAALADRFNELGQLTWAQIQSADKHGLGHEKINRESIRGSIPSAVSEDVTFLAFRFSGKKPMVGYRNNKIFYIIWLDNDFTLYNHG